MDAITDTSQKCIVLLQLDIRAILSIYIYLFLVAIADGLVRTN